MRVYEFAKEHNKTSKEILELLHSKGFDAKSHMSLLSEEALSFLNQSDQQKLEKVSPQKSAAINPDGGKKDLEQELVLRQKNKQRVEEKIVEKQYERGASLSSHIKTAEAKSSILEEKEPLFVEPMALGVFCEKAHIPVNEVILSLLREGKVCTKNNILKIEEVQDLALRYAVEVITKKASFNKDSQKKENAEQGAVEVSGNAEKRLPVVVVMGHVDHGKTTLLDFIRKTRVAVKEKGGITQHLGAYKANTDHGDIVFLDTPGHEAFSKIRKRGASVADIAILVVAADDGIMPQTLESIRAAKALDIPVIVAINKIDRVDISRLEVIKRQLTQYELVPEDWGGTTICVPISAKEGTGVDHLLEMVALQAEMMELKAALDVPAFGYILESKIQKGRGSVATVLCKRGILRIGDYFSSGPIVGRVTSLTDSFGKSLKETLPSIPVLVTGFDSLADVGEEFSVIDSSLYKTLRAGRGAVSSGAAVTSQVQNYLALRDNDETQRFNLILKADTNSSLEALLDAIAQFDIKETKHIILIRAGVGNVTESDALLAEDVSATIVGFHVKAERNALSAARQTKTPLLIFDVIYKLIDELKELAVRAKEIKKVRTKIGEGEVLKVFNIKKLGVIAGCIVREGRFSGEGIMRIKRGRKDLGEGKIKSLQRDKKTVKEVHAGFDCAFLVENFEDWQEGDSVECYIDVPTVR